MEKGHKLFEGLLVEEGGTPAGVQWPSMSKTGSFSLPTCSTSSSSPLGCVQPPSPSPASPRLWCGTRGSVVAITFFFHWPRAEIKAAQASSPVSLALCVLWSTHNFHQDVGNPVKLWKSHVSWPDGTSCRTVPTAVAAHAARL